MRRRSRGSAGATVSPVQLTVVDHPLARARLTRMRDERTDNAMFRAALRELTQMLIYEATRDLRLAEEQITTPVTGTTGRSEERRVGKEWRWRGRQDDEKVGARNEGKSG